MSLTAVCLFDGVGGFPLALSRAGIRTVLSCEIDPAARGVLADQFDHVLHDDVRTLTADDCRAAGFVSERGILCGGFPCQDLSVAGRRAGLGGARSGLFFEVVRLADALRPRWLVLENVPGLLSSNDGRDMGAVVGALGELGYGWAYRVLDAQHFGVPQRRRRVVIVGCLGDRAAPVQVLFEPEGVSRDSASGGEPSEIASALTANGLGGGGADDNLGQARHIVPALISRYGKGTDSDATDALIGYTPDIAFALTAARDRGVGQAHNTTYVAHTLTAGTAAKPAVNDAQANHLIGFDLAQITSSVNRSNPKPGDPMTPLLAGGQPHVAHALTAEGHDASEDGTGRGTPLVPVSLAVAGNFSSSEDVAQTVRAAHGQPGVVATTAVRRLTPLECERLQGFPDNWTATSNGKPQADSPRYRQMGNAIAVPVFEWVARRIAAVDAKGAVA